MRISKYRQNYCNHAFFSLRKMGGIGTRYIPTDI